MHVYVFYVLVEARSKRLNLIMQLKISMLNWVRYLNFYTPCIRNRVWMRRRTLVTLLTTSLLVIFVFFTGDIRHLLAPKHILGLSENILDLSGFDQPVEMKRVVYDHGFVLDTPGCQIPDWDPFDPTVLHLISFVNGTYECPGRPPFLHADPNGVLTLNQSLFYSYYALYQDNLTCFYQPIVRYPGKGRSRDNMFYFDASKALEFGVPLEDEFVFAKCTFRDLTLTQFVPLTPLKTKVENVKSKVVPSKDAPLNIIIVGVDSVSKLNFLRHFRRTYKFIQEHLPHFELNGYTKVADNTFPNLVPLLTGQFIEHFWNESLTDMFFDDVGFVWKNYSARGFRTLFAEDAPAIATFNYLKNGFRDPPVDYYFRPFASAVELSLMRKESKAHCFHSQLEMDILYDYLKTFLRTMDARPSFSFTFVARLTHDAFNAAGYADEPTFRLMKDLHEDKTLNKSLLILFSDHGIRFGPIRQTYIGKFEERMPFMFLLFPKWFLRRHPGFARNLRQNQNRLTTPFDVHATLVHLLNVTAPPLTGKGLSLLTPIPEERTCADAYILPHWCPCQIHTPVPVDEPEVTHCARALIDTVNEQLTPYEKDCATLRLDRILDARIGQANNLVLRFVEHQNDVVNQRIKLGKKVSGPRDYLIVVSALPSGAIFEGTVRHHAEDGTYRVLDDISRLNMYGNQSDCIDSAQLRKFCYCKSHVTG